MNSLLVVIQTGRVYVVDRVDRRVCFIVISSVARRPESSVEEADKKALIHASASHFVNALTLERTVPSEVLALASLQLSSGPYPGQTDRFPSLGS